MCVLGIYCAIVKAPQLPLFHANFLLFANFASFESGKTGKERKFFMKERKNRERTANAGFLGAEVVWPLLLPIENIKTVIFMKVWFFLHQKKQKFKFSLTVKFPQKTWNFTPSWIFKAKSNMKVTLSWQLYRVKD